MHHRVIYSSMLGESKMSVESFVPAAMQFTQGAANKVKALVEEEGNPRLKLRVFVTGGGCSGFQYGFTFDDELAEDDTLIEREGLPVVIVRGFDSFDTLRDVSSTIKSVIMPKEFDVFRN